MDGLKLSMTNTLGICSVILSISDCSMAYGRKIFSQLVDQRSVALAKPFDIGQSDVTNDECSHCVVRLAPNRKL